MSMQHDEGGQAGGAGFSLADELLAHREEGYVIDNEIDPSDLPQQLDTLIDTLSLSPSSIDVAETFDQIKSFLLHFSTLGGAQRSKLLDCLSSAYGVQIDAATRDLETEGIERYKEHAETLERYAFSLQWLVNVAEKAFNSREEKAAAAATASAANAGKTKTKSTLAAWDWQRAIPVLLATLTKSLKLSTSILFPLSAARDAFVSGCVLRPTLLLQENEGHMKLAMIKMSVFKVICNCVKNHGQAFAVQTSIMQALAYYEHLSEPMAELLTLLRLEFDYERLGDEVLREVAGREFGGLDTKGPRCFARFLVRMAELSPRNVLRNISLLNKHLDSDSYPMRNAMLEVLGTLIKDLTTTDDALPSSSEGGREDQDLPSSSQADDEDEAQRERGDVRKRQVEQFWDLICERFLDMNSYVRCKCIAVAAKLCDLEAKFPAQRALLTEYSIRSLSDKSSTVRKNAIALLTRLILTHPYGRMHGGELDKVEWEKRLKAIDDQLHEFDGVLDVPNETEGDEVEEAEDEDMKDDEAANQTATPGMEDDEAEEADKTTTALPGRRAKPRLSVNIESLVAQLSAADAEKVIKLRLTRKYYADAVSFIDQLAEAVPTLAQLLVSTSKAEVLESMEFFRVAHEYKISGANVGVRKMIHLIWTKDNNTLVMEDGKELKGIRSRLIEVYRSLYFDPLPTLSTADNITHIARNLVERTFGVTLAELTSLEEMLSTMCSEGMIDERVIDKLWSVYGSSKAIPRAQRRGAIIVLSMLAVAKKEIVSEHIDTLLSIGLGSLGAKDVVLAKYTCIALSRVGGSVKKVKGALSDNQVRYPMTHPMFARLRAAIQWPSVSGQWFSLAEHAIQTIYLLGEQPDALCAEMIKQMTARVFGTSGPRSQDLESHRSSVSASVPPTPSTSNGESSTSISRAPAFALAQILFVVGHVALKQIVYLELVEREFKRRKAEADKEKVLANKDTNKARISNNEAEKTASKKGKGGGKRGKKESTPAAEDGDELDQVAGNAEDEIGDVVGEVREKELLYGPYSLLSLFGPVVVHICSNPTAYANDFLRKAAVLTMCKFMCVSSQFCEDQLPLVLEVLVTSQDPVIRSNIVIALGDCAISFGSLIDENSEKLYAGLGDADLGVKKHTLMVLTHLILNGQVKAKGQLGEMAKCLEDEDERVADLAKLFFTELATKDNAVYNNLPDIISHLSIGQHAVDEETFGRVMRFVFQFVDKERQAENVVEKLCQRFALTTNVRQWRDIAFCLALLPFKSDRSMKRLIEGLQFYRDKLYDPTVFKRFTEILAKARTNRTISANNSGGAPAAGETELQEFEQILETARAHGAQDAELENATQAKLARARRRGEPVASIPPPDDVQLNDNNENAAVETTPRRPTREARGKAKPAATRNTTIAKAKSTRRPATRRRGARRAAVSDEDEDEDDEDFDG
jgi:condensin complex subunit 1